MYINTGYQITNTPTAILAAYNTWQYLPPKSQWFQHIPVKYIDHTGRVREWNEWTPPPLMHIAGGLYNGTPTRTAGVYTQNMIIEPNPVTRENSCNFSGHY